jgi:thiol-disulfide isomerase/thioredoxin
MAIVGAIPPMAWLAIARMQQLPRVEPPFERLVGSGSGPIKELDIAGVDGRIHTTAEWSDRPAAVLLFLSPDCPVSRDYAPTLDRMARRFATRGVLFLGIDPTAGMSPEAVARRWSGWDLSFPILFDGKRRVARQAGVEVTPEAVVILPDGQVVYRGRVDDRYGPDGRKRSRPGRSELEEALEAVLAGLLPTVAEAPAHGTPLSPMASPGEGSGEPVTFNKHVAPILWNNCARCHRPGDVGPFPLLSYRDAARRVDFIREVVDSGQMPPWKAHPGAGVFLDVPRMTVLEKEVLARWAETGCAEGNPSDLPPMPRFPEGWALGPPDLVLTMPEAWELVPSRYDTYRAFALPMPKDRDVTITGIEFHPGNRRIVHHSRIHVDETGDARRREAADPTPGFAGWMGRTIVELPYPGLGGWTPGLTPRHAPEGSGRIIPRRSEIILQIHYHPTGKVESDRSSVGLYFAKQPLTRRMAGVSISTDRIDIPAGAKRHVLIQAARIKADLRLYTVVPHAHYLCREFRLAATLPDGTIRPLLWINDWDFDWQDQYRYALPVRLPKDTVLTFAAYFDNSEENPRNPNKPPRRVRYGIESRDEMCACHLEFLPEDPTGYAEYPNKSPFGM